MKFTKSPAPFLSAILISILLLPMFSPGSDSRPVAPFNAPVQMAEVEFESEEHLKARDEWQVFQRQYPFTSIPSSARRDAYLSLPKPEFSAQAGGDDWQAIGPLPITSSPLENWGYTTGRINSVAVSPADPQIVLVGGADGGVWRSTDGGATFVPVTDSQVDLSVGSIAFSKINPSIVYVGMGSVFLGTGVLKSTDSGETWARVSNDTLPSPGVIRKIAIDPTDANRVYVAQFSAKGADGRVFSSGFHLSTDGGVSWRKTLTGLPEDLAIDSTNPQKLYVTLSRVDEAGSPPAGLYRSTNGGATWSFAYGGPFDTSRFPRVRVAVAESNSQIVYVFGRGAIGTGTDIRVAASTDGGTTWDDRGITGLKNTMWDYIAVDPVNPNTLYIGLEDLFKSTDGGMTWANMTKNYNLVNGSYRFQPDQSNSHTDQHGFAFSPADSRTIYIGTDGGLYKSTNGGNTFQPLNTTLSLTQFYGLTLHPEDRGISYGGTQDNGFLRRLREPMQWKEFITGDGGHSVINPLNPSQVFSTYIFGTIFRWGANATRFEATVGNNLKFGESEDQPRISFIAPFTGNEVDSTLYFGTWRLFTSSDLGNTWQAPAGMTDLTKGVTQSGTDVLTAIGVARSDTKVIYTGSAQGRAMVSADGGKNWNDITAGLPNRFIKSISVDPQNPSVAYLTVSGYQSGHVFKTVNMGASWADISGNLADIPTNALLVDPLDPNTLFVGTDIGVFRSLTGGFNWEYYSAGMPPVVVNDFAAQSNGLIQAATYGRGIYELIRDNVVLPKPAIDIVTLEGKKLTINGSKFGSAPRVVINDVDRSDFITSISDGSIRLKGKQKKMGMKTGDNNVQVFDLNGSSSNIYKITL